MLRNNPFSAPILARTLAVTILVSLLASGCATLRDGPMEGEEVVFFPSAASISGNGQWSLTIQGRIFEPAEHSPWREELITSIAPIIGVAPGDVEQSKLFRERARYFLSDSSRNRGVSVKLGDESILLPASDAAGYFTAELSLTNEKVARLARAGTISFESLPAGTNPRRFPGLAVLVPEEGVTVVSDVDDTIKVTDIRNPREKMANTFLRQFVAVPGMPELYRSWKAVFGPRIHFHIVSAGPWQLYEPLRRFTETAEFPAFTWTMRSVDIGNAAVLLKELNADPCVFKLQAIRALMTRFPNRRVVLVGDSGEKDPEVYAKIVSEHRDRVIAVYIRDVTGQDRNDGRYTKLYPDKAAAKLCVFRHPNEIPPLAPSSVGMAPCATKG